MFWTIILAALALLSLVLNAWQWLLAARFPLHRRASLPPRAEGVTLLKPLKGSDAETEACLRSWLEQDHAGELQFLFGVASAEDPVCPLVRQLIAAYPQRKAELVVCPERLGPNAKVSTLIQLESRADHSLIVVSDADVWVPRDLLADLVTRFAEPQTGLVCCFYRLANAVNFGMKWEALGVNADFWSSVLQAQSLKPIDFALGAVMGVTRRHLKAIGGFRSLVDYLADDYQLGHKIAAAGGRIAICPVVAECRSRPMNWREVWAHQLRWSRTIRVCQAAPYFFSILSNATLWPLCWLAAAPGLMPALGTALCLGLRLAGARYCEQKILEPAQPRSWWIAPIKDLLQVVVWALAFMGNHVTWRGNHFRVMQGGRLISSASPEVRSPTR